MDIEFLSTTKTYELEEIFDNLLFLYKELFCQTAGEHFLFLFYKK